MLRSNLLFVHVISAMGLFATLGMEALAIGQLRHATDGASGRGALTALASSQRIGGPLALTLLLSGLWLASAFWRWQGAWMGLGFVALIVIGALAGAVTGRLVRRLQRTLNAGTLSASLLESLPTLRTSFAMRSAIAVGVVYLMTAKPTSVVSLSVFGASIVAGLFLSRSTSRVSRAMTS